KLLMKAAVAVPLALAPSTPKIVPKKLGTCPLLSALRRTVTCTELKRFWLAPVSMVPPDWFGLAMKPTTMSLAATPGAELQTWLRPAYCWATDGAACTLVDRSTGVPGFPL